MSARQRRKRDRRRRDAAARSEARRRRVLAGAGITLGVGLGLASSAQAAPHTFTVGSIGDGSGASDCESNPSNTDCTLRDAIIAANSNANSADQDIITFKSGLSGTIAMTAAFPTIVEPVSIQGPGTAPGNSAITIDGSSSYEIFRMTGNDYAFGVSGLTLRHGYLANGGGGAIYVTDSSVGTTGEPRLTVQNTVLSGNTAAAGGAIYAFRASVDIQSSDISGNSTDGAHGSGGGVALNTHLIPSTIQDSTISGNHTSRQYAEGGGLSLGAYGDTTITGSTIADNYTTGQNANGGGIAFDAPTQNPNNAATIVENSTIADNSTSGTGASGGGMFVRHPSDLKIANATISGNSTAGFGGGIYDHGGLAHPDITNSILSGGSAGQKGPELYAGTHTMEDTHFDIGFSLIENPANAQIHTDPLYSNISGVDPQLGPLQDNGGSTYTEAPALTSPVIDCGTSAGATTDQRGAGFDRPKQLARTDSPIAPADGSDMGAFEVQSGAAGGACANIPRVPTPPQPPPQSDLPLKKCKKNKKKHNSSAQVAKKKCKKKKKK